jgi:hypothetical protein
LVDADWATNWLRKVDAGLAAALLASTNAHVRSEVKYMFGLKRIDNIGKCGREGK